MANGDPEKPSTYINYLPGIFHGDADKSPFVGRYLKIFEKLLSGIDDGVTAESLPGNAVDGIEQVLERIHEFFTPETTPGGEFLSWLAGWTALVLREDWDDVAKRKLLRQIIPLYSKRGTRSGLTEYLRIFVGQGVDIQETIPGIVVGNTGRVGIDTFVGGLSPHYFLVNIRFDVITDVKFVQNVIAATKAIVDLEKPAHTHYALRFEFPGIIVGHEHNCKVGINTIIGSKYPIFV